MKIEELDFHLPADRIAQQPAARRDHSRLMVVNRSNGEVTHARFNELARFLPEPVHFFRNRIRVRKARLYGQRASGGRAECFLLEPETSDIWQVLLKPSKKLPVGSQFTLPGNSTATVLEKLADGICRVKIDPGAFPSVEALAEASGKIPLPPYIRRDDSSDLDLQDEQWYQTVFNRDIKPPAAAAPTAGLHFTPELLQQLTEQGHEFLDLDLTVGLGTFKPIQTDHVEEHPIHHEQYWIANDVWEKAADPSHRLRLMVGTTTLRAMEDAALHQPPEGYSPQSGEISRAADIFLYPPARFRVTDALLTNFHLPRSTLLCLVGAFLKPEQTGGLEWLKELYAEAVSKNYRFFSYGDAMLIL